MLEEFPPEISGAPMALAAVNQLYFFQPLASDLNGDQLEFASEKRMERVGYTEMSMRTVSFWCTRQLSPTGSWSAGSGR